MILSVIGSKNGLVPSGNKPLPEPILTKIHDVMRDNVLTNNFSTCDVPGGKIGPRPISLMIVTFNLNINGNNMVPLSDSLYTCHNVWELAQILAHYSMCIRLIGNRDGFNILDTVLSHKINVCTGLCYGWFCCGFNSSPSGQNGRHFSDDIFRCIFVNEKFCILI